MAPRGLRGITQLAAWPPAPDPRGLERLVTALGAQTCPGFYCLSLSAVCAGGQGENSSVQSISKYQLHVRLRQAPRLPRSFDITLSGFHLIAKMSSFLKKKKNLGIKKVTLGEGKRSPPYFLNHSGLGRELSSVPGRAASHHPHGLCLVGGPPRLFLATGNSGSCLQLDTLRVPDGVAFRKAGLIYGAGTTGHARCHHDTEAFLPQPQSTPLPRLQAASVTHRETQGPTRDPLPPPVGLEKEKPS